jgi:hypothetical protein
MPGAQQSAQVETDATAASKLVDGLRALIAEEVGRTDGAKPPAKTAPKEIQWRDTLWLLVVIANVVTIATLTPDEWMKKDRWEFFFKLIPWLFGGLFLTNAAWVRDRFLAVSRNTAFRVSQLVLLSATSALQFQIFSITPTVLPPKAVLLVDGAPKRRRLHLSFANHEVQIVPPETPASADASTPKLQPRKFTLTRWQLLSLSVSGRAPEWSLVIPVDLSLDNKGYTVEIRRADSGSGGNFPSDFLESTDLDVVDPRLVRDTIPPAMDSEEIALPIGKYKFSVVRDGCRTEITKTIALGDDGVTFPPMTCGAQ